MLRFFRNLPIKHKLMVLTMAISGVALLIASVGFALSEQAAFRRSMARDFSLLAHMFGDNVASGLAFNDAASIEQTLKALSVNQHIVAAGVYDKQGALIGGYRRRGVGPEDRTFRFPAAQPTGQRFGPQRLETFQDITLAGEVIGVVYVGVDLDELRERAWRYVGFVSLLLAGCSLVAWLLAARLQRLISQPILDLAQTVATIAKDKNYAVRATKPGDDELGQLIDGFNEMLNQIQARDTALERSRQELENRVEERTRELAKSLSLLNATLESTTDGIVAVDLAGRAISYNSKFTALWQFPPELLARRDAAEMRAHTARLTKDEPAFLQLSREQPAMLAAEKFDLVELKDGRTFERYVFPQLIEGRGVGTVISWRDITARKKAEESLRLLNTAVNQAKESVLITDAQLDRPGPRIVFTNPAFTQMTGYTAEEVLGGTPRILQGPRTERAVLDRLRKNLAAGEVFSGEAINYRKGGQEFIIEWQIAPLRDTRGIITHFVAIQRDITARKQVELALQDSEERYRSLIENATDAIFTIAADGTFTSLNLAVETLLGSPRRAWLGQPFLPMVDPADVPLAREMFQSVLQGRPTPVHELRSSALMPRPIVMEMTLAPQKDKDGKIIGVLGVGRDITARKVAEAELRSKTALLEAQLDSSLEGILIVDNEGKKIIQNKRLAVLWKIPAEIAASISDEKQLLFVIGRTKHPEQFAEKVRYLYAHPDESSQDEIEFKDGMVLERYSAPVTGREGKHYGRIWAFRDITERKRAALELTKVHQELVDASRQAGMAEIATGVLHNVGNVLNSVNVSATLIADQVRQTEAGKIPKLAAMFAEHQADLAAFLTTDPRGRMIPGYLGTLAAALAVEHAATLGELDLLRKNIDHIKEIVAVQQSYARASGIIETVALAEIVDDALRMNAGSFAQHGIETIRDYHAQQTVSTDKHKVMQILINLVRNAKDACDDSGRPDKRITLRTASDGHRFTIAVIDNGVGIPAENLTRIFNHGFTTRKEGHGFGLHSGALAARELGGSLTVQSAGPGLGATFTLDLPCQPESPAHENTARG